MESIITITTTTDNREALEKIGRHLLAGRLIACVQIIGPIRSIYWWKEKIEETEEWLGEMKTRKSLFSRVEAEIRTLHAYEVPEITAVETAYISHAYAEWVMKETIVV
jgi:periplasmic divalent cation tolerance protein